MSVRLAGAGLAAVALLATASCSYDYTIADEDGSGGGDASSSSGAPSSSSAGSGGSAHCEAAASCATATCETATCDDGLCVLHAVAAGKPAPRQVAGDCLELVCDASGKTSTAHDDSDVPASSNVCQKATCAGGMPAMMNQPDGTTCGTGLTCSSGACTGCSMPSECPAGDACKTPTCTAGTCGFAFEANGHVIADAANNCKRTVCDGAGTLVTQNDDTDVPASDGNPCTDEVCNNGNGSHPARAAGLEGTGEALCNGVCQDGPYAGTCGLSLYTRTFPAAGAYTRRAVSTVFTGPNAPPPTGILSMEANSTAIRLLVWASNGTIYQRYNGVWQTPATTASTVLPNYPTAGITGATIIGKFNSPSTDEIMIIITNETPPKAYSYTVPLALSTPISFQQKGEVTDESGKPNAPPQHDFPLAWGFIAQKSDTPTSNDWIVTWKGYGGMVYDQNTGTGNTFDYVSKLPDATSALAINGVGAAPKPGTIIEAYYDSPAKIVYLLAP